MGDVGDRRMSGEGDLMAAVGLGGLAKSWMNLPAGPVTSVA